MSRNQPAESLSPKMRCAIDACGSSSYSPKPSIWPAYLVFRALIRTLAAGPDEDAPVLHFGVSGAEAEQLVFDEERNDLGQANSLLLPVGEPGHVLALDQRLAGGGLDAAPDAGRMADQRHRLPGGEEGLDQLDGIRVFGQVPHRAVAARIEDGIVVLLFHAFEAHRLVELAFGVRVLFEVPGDIGLEAGILALGIEWRTTAFGRC